MLSQQCWKVLPGLNSSMHTIRIPAQNGSTLEPDITVLRRLGTQSAPECAMLCTDLRHRRGCTQPALQSGAYQVAIVEQALLHNTLVCLPTGLGKTFIAAVVMYNFFRWFPEVCSCQELAFPYNSGICVPPDMARQQLCAPWLA